MSENKVVSDAIFEAVKIMKENNQFPELQIELAKLVNQKPAPAVAAPAVAAPAVENDDSSEINDNEVISYNNGKTSSSYGNITSMLENTLEQEDIPDDEKDKIRNLFMQVMQSKKPTEVQTIMNAFGTLAQVGEGSSAYYKITETKGGTRKRRNKLQRKRVKTMKNKKKKKVGKRK